MQDFWTINNITQWFYRIDDLVVACGFRSDPQNRSRLRVPLRIPKNRYPNHKLTFKWTHVRPFLRCVWMEQTTDWFSSSCHVVQRSVFGVDVQNSKLKPLDKDCLKWNQFSKLYNGVTLKCYLFINLVMIIYAPLHHVFLSKDACPKSHCGQSHVP